MATTRRRRTASSRSRSKTSPPRKRRKIKTTGTARKPQKKRNKRKPVKKSDIKNRLQKIAIIFFFIADAVLIYFFIRHCSVPAVTEDPQPVKEPVRQPVQQSIQIEVLNGCGVSGIAALFTEFLRDSGFDVVRTDNYMENGRIRYNVLETTVVDRRGNIENARRIAAALRLDEDKVLSEPNELYLLDATVILGEDFKRMQIWKTLERDYGE